MRIIVKSKETHEITFQMECREYSTFFASVNAVAERFEMPLDVVKDWVNEEPYGSLNLENDKFKFKLLPNAPLLVFGYEYELDSRPSCVYCGSFENEGDGKIYYRFHQQATCGGVFTLSQERMKEVTMRPEKMKYLTFEIAYIKKGETNRTIERIEARNHETASQLARLLGEVSKVEFVPGKNDLIYLH